jgi:hypothetical protein
MMVDMNEVVLTDEHRRAIAETLVGREVDLARVCRQLESALEGYQVLEQDRKLKPPRKARDRRQHTRELISQLVIGLRGDPEGLLAQLKDIRQNPIAGHDELEPELVRIIREQELELATLEAMRRRVDSHIENLDTLCRAFDKKRNPYRKNLYIGVLRIWTDIVGDTPTYSRPWAGGGEPFGPLINFFHACLAPVLGDKMPGPHGIAAIIDRVGEVISERTII